MPDTTTRIAQVAVVGRAADSPFLELMRTLRRNEQLHVFAEYENLSSALEADLGSGAAADFVIVLQSYSDQFTQDDINTLIGRMLFGRILCCYGPWCTADGRSHELWPVTLRVPAASAPALLDLELAGFLAGEQPPFPMSAGEEVFAHRSQFVTLQQTPAFGTALVVSNDSVLRDTVADILSTLECQATVLPLVAAEIPDDIQRHSQEKVLVLIDLDSPQVDVSACLSRLQTLLPMSVTVGLSVFAAALDSCAECNSLKTDTQLPQPVIEKTELLFQLRQLLDATRPKGNIRNA